MNVIIVIRKLLGVWQATTYDTSDTKTTAVIAIIEAPEDPILKRVRVTVDRLNSRDGPGIEYRILRFYTRGEVLNIHETRLAWGRTDNGWINLAYTVEV